MRIRQATVDDADGIRRVARNSLDASYGNILDDDTIDAAIDQWYSPDTLSDDLKSDELLFVVAADDDTVAAFSQSHVVEDRNKGRVLWLHVDPEYRGHGLGTDVFEHTTDLLKSRGIDSVTGLVLAENEEGNRFYRDHGFELLKQRTVQIGGSFHAENVYVDSGFEPGDLNAVETTEGTLYVNLDEEHRGKDGPFYAAYKTEDGGKRFGWYCGACESANNAMDAMGRVECNDCGNVRKATRWDAAYL